MKDEDEFNLLIRLLLLSPACLYPDQCPLSSPEQHASVSPECNGSELCTSRNSPKEFKSATRMAPI